MILVAVGTQFPFDRLIETVDRWAGQTFTTDVVAQTGSSCYAPRHIAARAFVPPAEFQALLERADVVIAHCGMGSILSALTLGKEIVVMPRSAALGEHRNDHQFSTAKRFADQPGVTVAWNEQELVEVLSSITDRRMVAPPAPISVKAPRALTDKLRAFLMAGD